MTNRELIMFIRLLILIIFFYTCVGCSSGGNEDDDDGDIQKPGTIENISHPSVYGLSISKDGSKLFALDRGDGSSTNQDRLIVIDTATHNTLTDITLGIGFAFNVALSPDETIGYISVSDFSGSTDSIGVNRVDVVDLVKSSILDSIPVSGGGAIATTVLPTGDKVYVADRFSHKVFIIDVSNNTVVGNIDTGTNPTDSATTLTGDRLYVANRGDASLTVITTHNDSILTTVPLSISTSPNYIQVVINAGGNLAYVSTAESNDIAVVDIDPTSPTYHQQTATITTLGTGIGLSRIAITHGGHRLLATERNGPNVRVIDINSASSNLNTKITDIMVGANLRSIVTQKTSVAVAYTSHWPLVNISTLSVLGSGFDPDQDEDGLSDSAEAIYGTALDVADSDGDGVKDGMEVDSGSDPLVASP